MNILNLNGIFIYIRTYKNELIYHFSFIPINCEKQVFFFQINSLHIKNEMQRYFKGDMNVSMKRENSTKPNQIKPLGYFCASHFVELVQNVTEMKLLDTRGNETVCSGFAECLSPERC